VEELVKLGRLTGLDRATIAETIKEIHIFESGGIEVTYLFSEGLFFLETARNEHYLHKGGCLKGSNAKAWDFGGR
jgi:hypothetical protein